MSSENLKKKCEALKGRKDDWLLLLRIAVGSVFFQAGLGKFMNFDRTAAFFTNIGIPLPELNTVLAAGTELIGGAFLILGFMTQLVSVPLAFVMFIALITAHLGDINSLMDLFSQTPFIYLLIFLLLSSTGAGKWSLDKKYCPTQKD